MERLAQHNEVAGGPYNTLNNTGYRREIHKTDKINSNYFKELAICQKKFKSQIISVQVPKEVTNIEQWLLLLLQQSGYCRWEDILPELDLPNEKMIITNTTDQDVGQDNLSPNDIIRNAAILSKCNKAKYDPESPMIFSYQRINRSVNLVLINLKSFYELD